MNLLTFGQARINQHGRYKKILSSSCDDIFKLGKIKFFQSGLFVQEFGKMTGF